jgi:hypothetical protein
MPIMPANSSVPKVSGASTVLSREIDAKTAFRLLATCLGCVVFGMLLAFLALCLAQCFVGGKNKADKKMIVGEDKKPVEVQETAGGEEVLSRSTEALKHMEEGKGIRAPIPK